MNDSLSHLNSAGEANMVDVTDKAATHREAVAGATVVLGRKAYAALIDGNNKKGDVMAVARIAGIQAAKKCAELIPLCHPLALTSVDVSFQLVEQQTAVKVRANCKLQGVTGVEMEALTAVLVAALTIYDMCKAVDKGIVIENVQLLEKSGGKSGCWQTT